MIGGVFRPTSIYRTPSLLGIYPGRDVAKAYLDASVAREAWSTREGFRILLLYITPRHTPAIMYHPIS